MRVYSAKKSIKFIRILYDCIMSHEDIYIIEKKIISSVLIRSQGGTVKYLSKRYPIHKMLISNSVPGPSITVAWPCGSHVRNGFGSSLF